MILRRLCLLLVLVSVMPQSLAREAKWADHQLVQYVAVGHLNPTSVLNMDNNGDILVAMRKGVTLEEIREAGLSFNNSQIFLLGIADLIAKVDGKYVPRIAFLEPAQTAAVREHSKIAAKKILAQTRDSWRKLAETIEQSGHQDHAYAIMYAYVLDGLSWLVFERGGQLPKRRTGKNKAWAGHIWALTPKREGAGGGTRIRGGNYALSAYLSEKTRPKMLEIFANAKRLRAMFDALREKGAVGDAELLKLGISWGMLNKEGKPAVAVLEQTAGNAVYDAAVATAEVLAKSVLEHLDLEALQKVLGTKTTKSALVMAYHEVMWDLADELENAGLFKHPAPLNESGRLTPYLFLLHDTD